jgi:sec-independent protein translocase protein TatA
MNEWVIVAIVAVVVIFGAAKLPNIARNVGKAQGEFKKGLKEGAVPEDTAPSAPAPPTNSEPQPPTTEA